MNDELEHPTEAVSSWAKAARLPEKDQVMLSLLCQIRDLMYALVTQHESCGEEDESGPFEL